MEVQFLAQLASTGVVGVLLVITLLALRSKDKELQDEKAARIKDAQDMMNLIMKLQQEVIIAVGKLSDLVESWEKREQARELTELRAAAARHEGREGR